MRGNVHQPLALDISRSANIVARCEYKFLVQGPAMNPQLSALFMAVRNHAVAGQEVDVIDGAE